VPDLCPFPDRAWGVNSGGLMDKITDIVLHNPSLSLDRMCRTNRFVATSAGWFFELSPVFC